MPVNIDNFTISGSMIQDTGLGGIVTDGLVLHLDAGYRHSYPMGGTTWYDLSGNGNNGTLTNGPTFSTSNGGSIVFDGSNDGVQLAGANLSLNHMTISSWNYSSNYNQSGFLFEKTTNGNVNTQYSLFLNNTNQIYFRTYGLSTTDLIVTTSTAGVINNQWNNIVATWDGVNKRIYVNGTLVGTSSNLTGTITQNSTGPAYIGIYGNFAGYPFNGRVAQTLIYSKALSTAEILHNYNASKIDKRISIVVLPTPTPTPTPTQTPTPLPTSTPTPTPAPDGTGLTQNSPVSSTQVLISRGYTTDGLYWLNIPNVGSTQVYCDLSSDSTGWVMVLGGGTLEIDKDNAFWNGTSHPNTNFTFKGNTFNTEMSRRIIQNLPFSQLRVTGQSWSGVSSVAYNANDAHPSPVIYQSAVSNTTFAQKKAASTSWTKIAGSQGALNWNATDRDGYTYGDYLLAIGPYGSNAYGDFGRAFIGGNIRSVGSYFGQFFVYPSGTVNCGRSEGCDSAAYVRYYALGGNYHRYSWSYTDDALWFKQ